MKHIDDKNIFFSDICPFETISDQSFQALN